MAKHIAENRYYLLKKVNTKEHGDRRKYQLLINEIGILKGMSKDIVIECHKMLKTSHNIYLVYEYYRSESLEDFIKERKFVSEEQSMIVILLRVTDS